MGRRLKPLAIFLLLGAVINAALAMGFIWFGPVRKSEWERFTFHDAPVMRTESLRMTRLGYWPMEVPGIPDEPGKPPAWSRIHRLPRPFMSQEEWHALHDRRYHEDVAVGWPLRSVQYEYDISLNRPAAEQVIIQSGIKLSPQQEIYPTGTHDWPRAIPLRIIPLGFAINTLLFATVAAMVWYTPPTLRHIRRKRGHRCLNCGYPRTGLGPAAPCPECGAPSVTNSKTLQPKTARQHDVQPSSNPKVLYTLEDLHPTPHHAASSPAEEHPRSPSMPHTRTAFRPLPFASYSA